MYLSRIRLRNWRSYSDCEFVFTPPEGARRIVLIGAQNGHGKTSLLFALYVGLYGRDGHRYTEGISVGSGDDLNSYRDAIRQFRRTNAKPNEDTAVEIEFAPTPSDAGSPRICIKRYWSFNSQGVPKQGEGFERIEVFENGEIQPLPSHDRVCSYLGARLFKDEVMPAFFFDGEQAQTLITKSGQEGMNKAVGVLYGTRLVEEAADHLQTYIQATEHRFGGKRKVADNQSRLDQLTRDRDNLESTIQRLRQEFESLQTEKTALEAQLGQLRRHSLLSGSDQAAEFRDIDDKFSREQRNLSAAKNELKSVVASLGLLLALSRSSSRLITAMQKDAELEQQQIANENTIAKADAILGLSMPEPPESDALLGNIAPSVRDKVKERIRRAIELVLRGTGESDGVASFPWLNATMRQEAIGRILEARHETAAGIRRKAQVVAELEESVEDLRVRRARIQNLPSEVAEIPTQIDALQSQIDDLAMRMGAARDQMERSRHEITRLNPEISKLTSEISLLEPERKKAAVAKNARMALSEIANELTKVTARRLERVVTDNFRLIADQRYRGGEIRLPSNSRAVLEREGLPPAPIESMSGFERRAFGIAFSLALAQITKRRIPFVIDTPLGNADLAYRGRLLSALSDVDIDQIIILTHDAEVTEDLQQRIAQAVLQKMLIEFDRDSGRSIVRNNSFFGDSNQ
jgi:DNA sulfur modification protein DndD